MAEVTSANAIAGLPEFTIAGLRAVPCASVETDFGHTQAPRPYPYRDVEGHDNTGRNASQFRVKLYFVNTVQPLSFPELWEQWRDVLYKGESHDCTHPLLGFLRVRVMQGTIPLVATVRGGIVVDVTFTETRDNPIEILTQGNIDLQRAAAVATEECAAVGVTYPTGNGDNTLGEDIAAVEGLIASGSMLANGLANQVIGKVDSMFAAVEALTDPKSFPAYDALSTVYSGLLSIGRRAQRLAPRQTSRLITQNVETIDAIATRTKNSDADIMTLNPALVRAPTIPKGTTVLYYEA